MILMNPTLDLPSLILWALLQKEVVGISSIHGVEKCTVEDDIDEWLMFNIFSHVPYPSLPHFLWHYIQYRILSIKAGGP